MYMKHKNIRIADNVYLLPQLMPNNLTEYQNSGLPLRPALKIYFNTLLTNFIMVSSSSKDLNAVILAGGNSVRMGEDKSQFDYHGVSQEVHLANICNHLGLETCIGKGYDYPVNQIDKYEVIKDKVEDQGPIAGIIAALKHAPQQAWLVLACDMPFVSRKSIEDLILERDSTCFATAYLLKGSDRYEPLFCIYEPKILPYLEAELRNGKGKVIAALSNIAVKALVINDSTLITNVNTLDQAAKVRQALK